MLYLLEFIYFNFEVTFYNTQDMYLNLETIVKKNRDPSKFKEGWNEVETI